MRMNEGKETWHRLLNWDRGQTPAERLAAIILSNEGFHNVDLSHPLGGPDGLKDIAFTYEGKKWIGAVYFPRGQKTYNEVRVKFQHDLCGVKSNDSIGLAFFTNQELTLSEREKLTQIDSTIDVQLYHLEKITSLLNTPSYYGIRMEFLDIEMEREEQLAFFASNNRRMSHIESVLKDLTVGLEEYKVAHHQNTDDLENDDGRTLDEIIEASEEFYEKVWFDRHLLLKSRVENGQTTINSDIWEGALKAAQRMIDKYGEDALGPYSDFEWGMLNGKLSALRWVLGSDWYMLDT